MDEPSSELLRRCQAGDPSAAETLFRRYFTRLHGLVRTRLSKQLAERLDADDVVQITFRSFFSGVRDGRYVLKRAGDLWRLLAAIAVNKLRHEERRHAADKRSLGVEQLPLPPREELDEDTAWLAREPTPEEAAMLADEVQALLRPLNDEQRRMVQLRLQGNTLNDIAEAMRCSQRTVRRIMDNVKRHLEERMRRSQEP